MLESQMAFFWLIAVFPIYPLEYQPIFFIAIIDLSSDRGMCIYYASNFTCDPIISKINTCGNSRIITDDTHDKFPVNIFCFPRGIRKIIPRDNNLGYSITDSLARSLIMFTDSHRKTPTVE